MLGKYSMNITEYSFTLASDLAAKIIGLALSEHSVDCHNRGGWQGNITESSPLWAQELVAALAQMFPDRRIHGVWLNVNGPGHSNRMHRHRVGGDTLVLYIQVPPNSGRVIFQHQRQRRAIDPQPGMILVFPGDIMHEVETNFSDSHRISLACNLVDL